MSKRPTDDFVLAKIDEAEALFEPLKKDLARVRLLFPLVREHRLRNSMPPAKGMECTRPEAILKVYEPDPEPKDLKAILFLLDALERLAVARRMLAERVPALDAALDKRKLEEEAPIGSRAVAEGACIVCENVVVRLKRGMCPNDYEAWRRTSGDPNDIGTWIEARRQQLEAA